VLRELRPIVSPLLAPDALKADEQRIIAACLAAEPKLSALRDIDFLDTQRVLGTGASDVHLLVTGLLERRAIKCLADNGDPLRTARCRDWCVERWNTLADAIDRVRDTANSAHVRIVSLR
jgi:hypothetical protein